MRGVKVTDHRVTYRAVDSRGKDIYGDMDSRTTLDGARRTAAGGLAAAGLGDLAKLTLEYDVIREDYRKGRGS